MSNFHTTPENNIIERYAGRVFRPVIRQSAEVCPAIRPSRRVYPKVKLDDLPPIYRRSLLSELSKQNPAVLTQAGTYFLHRMVDFNRTTKGIPFWEDFSSKFYRIIIP